MHFYQTLFGSEIFYFICVIPNHDFNLLKLQYNKLTEKFHEEHPFSMLLLKAEHVYSTFIRIAHGIQPKRVA